MDNERKKGGNELDVRKVLFLLRHNYLLVSLFIFIAFAISYIYVRYVTPIYEASCTIKIDKKEGGSNDFYKKFDIDGAEDEIQTEVEIFKSRTLTEKALHRLNWSVTYYSVGKIRNHEVYGNVPFSVNYQIKDSSLFNNKYTVDIINKNQFIFSILGKKDKIEYTTKGKYGESIDLPTINLTINLNSNQIESYINQKYLFKINDFRSLVGLVNFNLSVERVGKDISIIKATYKDIVALKAQEFLNTLSLVYIDENRKQKSEVASQTIDFIDNELKGLSGNLSNSEVKLADFKKSHHLMDISSQAENVLEKTSELELEKTKLDIQSSVLDDIVTYIEKNADFNNISPSYGGVVDPIFVTAIEKLKDAQLKYKILSTQSTKQSPELIQLSQSIEMIKADIVENIKNEQKNLKIERNSYITTIDEIKNHFSNLPSSERDYIDLQRNQALNENIYTYLIEKRSESQITKAATISPKRVLDSALLPLRPISPQSNSILIRGILIGLIGGVLTIILLNFLKTTFSNVEDLKGRISTPILGVISLSDTKKKLPGLVVTENPKSAISESFRSIRANLKFLADEDKTMIITTTSSTSGEGKTFCSINLGAITALLNKKVVIIDMDMRKPKVHIGFGVSNTIGISNYLIGKASLTDITNKSVVENLDFITAGSNPPNPSELINSERTTHLIEELKQHYDVILIDTPPVGLVSDSVSLIQKSNITLFIVRADYSKISSTEIVDKLKEDYKLNNLYVILNAVDYKKTSYGYDYGYGYGYYEDDQTKGNIFKRIKKMFS